MSENMEQLPWKRFLMNCNTYSQVLSLYVFHSIVQLEGTFSSTPPSSLTVWLGSF